MELVDFLKQYSRINNDFIDDFFGLYDITSNKNYCVDLDKVSLWLNSLKSDLKQTLLRSYSENIDYKITKMQTIAKGKKLEKIMLTPKCFKLLVMQSKSKKAHQVREYYYELENILDKYKNYIIKGMQDKINKLENNQKPLINPSKGVIYILETTDDTNIYTLGKTINLKKRMLSYNKDKSNNIVPLFIYETDDIDLVESCVKRLAKQYNHRKHKEIYKIDINMLKEMIYDCGEFRDKTFLKYKNKSQGGGRLYCMLSK